MSSAICELRDCWGWTGALDATQGKRLAPHPTRLHTFVIITSTKSYFRYHHQYRQHKFTGIESIIPGPILTLASLAQIHSHQKHPNWLHTFVIITSANSYFHYNRQHNFILLLSSPAQIHWHHPTWPHTFVIIWGLAYFRKYLMRKLASKVSSYPAPYFCHYHQHQKRDMLHRDQTLTRVHTFVITSRVVQCKSES